MPEYIPSIPDPTITVVHYGAVYVIILADDPVHPTREGIIGFNTTLEAALDHAYTYMYDQLYCYRSPITTFWKDVREGRASESPAFVSLSNRAHDNLSKQMRQYAYNGHSPHTGLLVYVRALLNANPNPTADWTDTRPDDLRKHDLTLLKAGKLPVWFYDYEIGVDARPQRCMNKMKWLAVQPELMALSNEYGILSAKGLRWNPSARSSTVLEAIGLGRLTPVNEPNMNPRPINPKNHRRRDSRPPVELVF